MQRAFTDDLARETTSSCSTVSSGLAGSAPVQTEHGNRDERASSCAASMRSTCGTHAKLKACRLPRRCGRHRARRIQCVQDRCAAHNAQPEAPTQVVDGSDIPSPPDTSPRHAVGTDLSVPMPASRTHSERRRRADQHAVLTQNCRGIKTDARTWELLDSAKRQHAYAVCLQETWRAGAATGTYCESGYTLVEWGPPLQQGRGSAGVGIAPSRAAYAAWQHAGGEQWRDEAGRVLALRCKAKGCTHT